MSLRNTRRRSTAASPLLAAGSPVVPPAPAPMHSPSEIEAAADLDMIQRAILLAEDDVARARRLGWRRVRPLDAEERQGDVADEMVRLEEGGVYVVASRHEGDGVFALWRRPRAERVSDEGLAAIRDAEGADFDGAEAA